MLSYQYRDPHVKDKTVSPTVFSLTWESPYLGKTVFILRQGPAYWNIYNDILCYETKYCTLSNDTKHNILQRETNVHLFDSNWT